MTSSLPGSSRQAVQVTSRQPGDEKLGFEGCVASLGKLAEKNFCQSLYRQ